MRLYHAIGVVSLFLIGSCAHNNGEQAEHHHDAGEGEEHANEIVMEPEQARAAGVEVSIIRLDTFSRVIRASGRIVPAQGEEATAVAPVSGVVRLGSQLSPGTRVSPQTTLFVISGEGVAEGDVVSRARIDYETAKAEYERMSPLAESGIVTQKEFARVSQEYETTRLAYEAMSANHTDRGLAVRAPLSGYVKSLLVSEGDYVGVGQPLATVAQGKHIYLEVEVSQRYYPYLSSIRSARFSVPYDERVYDVGEMNGRLLSYGKSSGEAHYIPMTFEMDNVCDIVPGACVEVFLIGQAMEGVVVLPRSAITEEQGSHFVYRQVDEEGYVKQPVVIGGDDGREVLISSGVEVGQPIVVSGANQLKLASASHAIPAHTHNH